jgi:hypothetical protein
MIKRFGCVILKNEKHMVGVKGLGARGESIECQKLAVYS